MNKIQVVIGPTASGKSELSLELAKKNKSAIISADAFQIYNEFNIGTGKLTHTQMQGIQHFLIDDRDPNMPYSVQDFLNNVHSILNNHSTPFIICGGSAMYLKALLYGYQPLKRLPEHQRPKGTDIELWDQLNHIDPALAAKTPYQNKQRVQRYLEIYQIYHVPPSDLFKSNSLDTNKYQVIGILIETSILKERINKRVNFMIESGLVDEVEYLMKKYDINSPPFQAIGYKEPIQFIQGNLTKDKMIDLIKKNSYQYAKRQMTWFKAFDHVQWISKK